MKKFLILFALLSAVATAAPTSEQVYQLNRMNSVAQKTQLGTLIQGAYTPADGSVTTAKIAALAVTSAKLAASSVTAAKIGTGEVGTAALASSSVTLAKLATGIAPAVVAKFAGTVTTTGGQVETLTVAGVLTSDLVIVTVKTVGGTPVVLYSSSAGNGVINVAFSADPSTDHILNYIVFRAAS